MAKIVSDIGTPRIIIGTINETKVMFLNPRSDNTDIMNPKNKAPVSPIKILAG
jgi:hypothetical protein